MKELIVQLCDERTTPIDGWNLKLPTFPKSHILFTPHLVDQLRTWGTLGGFDEQNIESCHAKWNLLSRQFGATRGRELKKKVMTEYLFHSAEFVREIIDRIKKLSKREQKKRSNRRRVSQQQQLLTNATTEELGADESDSVVNRINAEVAFHQELLLSNDTADNSNNGNNSTVSVKVTREDTMVHTCPHCKKKLLAVGLHVHMFESHHVCIDIGTQ